MSYRYRREENIDMVAILIFANIAIPNWDCQNHFCQCSVLVFYTIEELWLYDLQHASGFVAVNPPVTILLSDRPGPFFSIRFLTRSASDHTTVSQTGFFSFF